MSRQRREQGLPHDSCDGCDREITGWEKRYVIEAELPMSTELLRVYCSWECLADDVQGMV